MTHSVVFNDVTKQHHSENRRTETHPQLKDIQFTAAHGDVIGIIGTDRLGKTLLAELLSGKIEPNAGEITVDGRTAELPGDDGNLQLRLTGKENIEQNLQMNDRSKEKINEMLLEILRFAGISGLRDELAANYSETKKNRLKFVLTMEQNPDVLIVDEAMLDEDEPFAAVYKREMNRLAAEGKTVFIISSSMTHLQELCGKVLWLEAGKLKDDGPTETILPAYEKFLQQPPETEEKTEEVPKSPPLQQSDTEHAPKEEQAAAAETRTARNKQIFSGKVIRYILIAVLFIAAVFAAMVYLERGKDQPASSGVLEPDIRYVTVQTATVRDNAEFGSKITGKASFGQAFKVLETQDSSAASVKWLKVEGVTTDLKGWISNKFLEKVKEKADGNTVAAAVDDLIGFTPSLEEAIPMIGKKKGKETAFDYTEYMYDEDKVTGFTITVNDASDTVLKEALGEPHLQRKDKLLYHGGKYDFLFTLHGTGVIDSLTVTKN